MAYRVSDRRSTAKGMERASKDFAEEEVLPTSRELALRAVYHGYAVDGGKRSYWRIEPKSGRIRLYSDGFHDTVNRLWNDLMDGNNARVAERVASLAGDGSLCVSPLIRQPSNHAERIRQEGVFFAFINDVLESFIDGIGFPKSASGYKPLDFDDVRTPQHAAGEVAYNVMQHAHEGLFIARKIVDGGRTGVEIISVDRGPGIDDVPKAIERYWSSSQDSAGKGLSNLRLAMDEVEVESHVGRGTRIVGRKWLNV